ncbi:uncharacterized protein LOC124925235 [Impatiens glandulifera]|uniref:uncharacterized protein LOC124925235 n=1 Tax=Impatiens glandulifera TaxID=253017 RepID=UPI001FB197F3|nr:uncharacterized protein LOC124925235 [Impatiens glandulifera]
MGNTLKISPCCQYPNSRLRVSLIFHDGTTRIITGKHLAGEIMFEFPDMMVCPSNSFYIGCPVPILSIDDQLIAGLTYLVLPIDCFSSSAAANLSASSIASLASSPKKTPINFNDKPFEYLKGSNGRVLIKVSPEFLTRVLVSARRNDHDHRDRDQDQDLHGLCSTPELKKHYEQLVGNGKERNVWSPKLETISEYNNHNIVRFSPSRLLGLLERKKQREPSS